MSKAGITRLLNERGIKTDQGKPWTRPAVHGILTNSKYIGTTIYNRRSFKLSKEHVDNPINMWMLRDDPYGAIIPLAQFAKAQEILLVRNIPRTDDNLLANLRRLWAKRGKITARMIKQDESMPSLDLYRKRFQSLTRAYSLIGYTTSRHYSYHIVKGPMNRLHRDLCATVKANLRASGATVEEQGVMNVLLIDGQVTISIVLLYCNEKYYGPLWAMRFDHRPRPDIIDRGSACTRKQPYPRLLPVSRLRPDCQRRFASEKKMIAGWTSIVFKPSIFF